MSAVEGSGRFAVSNVESAVSASSEEGSSKPCKRAAVWSSSEAESWSSIGSESKAISSAAGEDARSAGWTPASACAFCIVDLTVEDFEVRAFFVAAVSEDVAIWSQYIQALN